jgi:hypothetical protein
MKRATITIPDELEQAIETYRRDLEIPPALAAIVQTALREYLTERGYFPLSDVEQQRDAGWEDELIPSLRGKPSPLKDAPKPKTRATVADAVVEDRR